MDRYFIHLFTCDTCRRIKKEIGLPAYFNSHDLKKAPIPDDVLNHLLHQFKPIELVNKRSRFIRANGLKPDTMDDQSLIKYLKEEYSFMKRPIIIDGDTIFIGNSKKTVQEMKEYFAN